MLFPYSIWGHRASGLVSIRRFTHVAATRHIH